MTDHELEQALRALYRADIGDHDNAPSQLRAELPALLAGASTQRGLLRGWTAPTVLRFAPLALAATAVVLMAFVGIGLLMRPNTGLPPAPPTSFGPTASPTEGERVRGWPGTAQNGPGLYSWDGATCHMNAGGDCIIGFMHNGYGSGDVEITIGTAGGSISALGGTPTTVAGHEATYRRVDARREEWLVDIQGTTYYIRLSAERGTSESDLAEAHAIIDSMRTEPRDNGLGFRLVFRLETDDWDSG